MNLISFIRQEFSYMTNSVRWRKWILSLVLIILTFSFLLNLYVDDNSLNISRGFAIFSFIFSIYTLIVNSLAFRTRFFSDVPKDVANTIVLSIIYTLWSRVQVSVITLIVVYYLSTLFDISLFTYMFSLFTVFVLYYSITLSESISTFIKMRQIGAYGDSDE